MSPDDASLNGLDHSESSDSQETVAVCSNRVFLHRRKHQFSLATLLVLQTLAGIAAFVTKTFGPSMAIAGLLFLMILAIPIAGTVWVANHFQQANQVGKRISLACVVIYVCGVSAVYLVTWWFS